MAGEIEEPLGLDFRVDSFRCGSISFGRYESEELYWERRSSFSHNRYLEEVEKFSKPGSVTEKKAYFEAHFRKKGFPSLGFRNEKDYQTSENDASEKACNEEENDHTTAQFDASVDGSLNGGDSVVTECETQVFENERNGASNVECIPENVAKNHKTDDAELGSSLLMDFESGIEMKENFDGETTDLDTCHESNMASGLYPDIYANEEIANVNRKDKQSSSPKGNSPSKSENIKPRFVPRVSAGQSRRCTSGSVSKGAESKSKAEKKTSGDANKYLMHKTTKYERNSKTKVVGGINSYEKGPRSRVVVEPQSSVSRKVSNTAHQSADRVKPAVGVPKPGMRKDICRPGYKSNEGAPRRKEEQPQADTKQFRKSLSSKAVLTPSFYRGALCVPDGKKVIPSNIEPRKQHAKTSIPEISPTSRKKEPEKAKNTSLRKGENYNEKQKAGIQRSAYSSFNGSSRASDHMAVGVAS